MKSIFTTVGLGSIITNGTNIIPDELKKLITMCLFRKWAIMTLYTFLSSEFLTMFLFFLLLPFPVINLRLFVMLYDGYFSASCLQ